MANLITLADWLSANTRDIDLGPALADTITALTNGALRVSHLTRTAPMLVQARDDIPLHTLMERRAHEIMMEAAAIPSLSYVASEDLDTIVTQTPSAPLALAMDPLDAASSIEGNVTTGTIFSIFPTADGPEASFLRPGHDQVAAGYVMHGPATILTLTLGRGVAVFVLDHDTGTFVLTLPSLETPADADTYAISAAYSRHWEPPVRAYIDDCVQGAAGPREKDFKMRWVGSLVAQAHRILTLGGVFLYPRDDRPGHEKGTLRHVFDVAAIAFIAEQAGGAATDCTQRLLDLTPTSLHARVPFVFGSRAKVTRVKRYHEDPDFQKMPPPLFAKRGLFRG